MRFSERIGITKPKVNIQKDNLDKETRNGIWNVIFLLITEKGVNHSINTYYFVDWVRNYLKYLWIDLFKKPIDELPINDINSTMRIIRDIIMEGSWYNVYDFLEYTVSFFKSNELSEEFNNI